jgi:hypothetical protein
MTPTGQSDSRELLLFFVRSDEGHLWLQETVDLECSDATFIAETRAEVYDRATEYRGQVAELRVRIPLALVFTEPPEVDAEVVQ